jgi:hypothetical protein
MPLPSRIIIQEYFFPVFYNLKNIFVQGKLEMFVDIFPDHMGQPGPPIDISPRKPKK